MTDTGAMSDVDTAHPGTMDDHDEHASGHGHAPAGEPLGPVDVTAWAYAMAGSIVGLVVAAALFAARGG